MGRGRAAVRSHPLGRSERPPQCVRHSMGHIIRLLSSGSPVLGLRAPVRRQKKCEQGVSKALACCMYMALSMTSIVQPVSTSGKSCSACCCSAFKPAKHCARLPAHAAACLCGKNVCRVGTWRRQHDRAACAKSSGGQTAACSGLRSCKAPPPAGQCALVDAALVNGILSRERCADLPFRQYKSCSCTLQTEKMRRRRPQGV